MSSNTCTITSFTDTFSDDDRNTKLAYGKILSRHFRDTKSTYGKILSGHSSKGAHKSTTPR